MDEYQETSRPRSLLIGGAGATKAAAVAAGGVETANAAKGRCGTSESPVLSDPEMKLDLERTALVVIDPQIDLLSPKGAAWPALGKGVVERNTIHNLSRLFKASKHAGLTVAISLTSEHLERPGSDFMPELKQYIEDGKTIICSPHTPYSPLPRVNDIGLRLRKRRVDQIILSGMIADLSIESHLRAFLEQGFEVAVVRDAVTGPKLPEGDGYLSTLVNFRRIANALWTTDETVKRLASARSGTAHGLNRGKGELDVAAKPCRSPSTILHPSTRLE